MKYDATTIIGVAVCVVLLLFWGRIMQSLGVSPPAPPEVVYSPAAGGPEEALPSDPEGTGGTDAVESSLPQEAVTETIPADKQAIPGGPVGAGPPAVAGKLPEFGERGAWAPATVTGFLSTDISTEGRGVYSVNLTSYRTADREGEVKLGDDQFPLACLFDLAGDLRLEVEGEPETDSTGTTLKRRTADGSLTTNEHWGVDPSNPYTLSYRVQLHNSGDTVRRIEGLGVTTGAMLAREPGTKPMRGPGAGGEIDVLFTGAGRAKAFSAKSLGRMKPTDRAQLAAASSKWLALHSKYFVTYLSGQGFEFSGCLLDIQPVTLDGQPNQLLRGAALLPPLVLEPGGSTEVALNYYVGPKELSRLRQIGNGVDAVMRMDYFMFLHPKWMGWLARQILRALTTLNGVFNNAWGYGFAIIVVTLVVKTLFWPLTHRSTVAMRRVQKLQPLVQEIRSKYKDQPEKMNRKVMEMYREHKANPLGGCLPMVFQIPVFFALFNTFRSAIQLRHASFLWVQDLSMPDTVAMVFGLPIRPLALLMAATMFGQMKLTPTSADPSQARMMTFMTVFFMFILYGMPAGLTLYWTVNQVLQMAQTYVSRKMEKPDPQPLAA